MYTTQSEDKTLVMPSNMWHILMKEPGNEAILSQVRAGGRGGGRNKLAGRAGGLCTCCSTARTACAHTVCVRARLTTACACARVARAPEGRQQRAGEGQGHHFPIEDLGLGPARERMDSGGGGGLTAHGLCPAPFPVLLLPLPLSPPAPLSCPACCLLMQPHPCSSPPCGVVAVRLPAAAPSPTGYRVARRAVWGRQPGRRGGGGRRQRCRGGHISVYRIVRRVTRDVLQAPEAPRPPVSYAAVRGPAGMLP